MSSAPTITSTRNRRIIEARKLSQRKHRADQGSFLVEGLQLLRMALDAGQRPIEVFVCPELCVGPGAASLLDDLGTLEVDTVSVSANVLAALSQRDTPQGLVTRMPLPTVDLASLALEPGGLVLVLESLRDPGNVGTLIRAADAVGAAAILLVEPATDSYDPRAVRASMGSLFNVPVVSAPLSPIVDRVRAAGLLLIGADLGGTVAWQSPVWGGGLALVLGTEGPGLSDQMRSLLDGRVSLPMRGGAESLNVAVAGGVLLYQWLQAHWPSHA